MAVTGKKTWYIAVVILGKEFKYAKITWDNDVITDLIKIEKDFWENNVIPEVMPDPEVPKPVTMFWRSISIRQEKTAVLCLWDLMIN
ncbi:MAG: hypothetical protein LIO44_00820 [Eubacterium sp.]|nr:hypothetical protein [Eubacterium sp.]